MKNSARSVSFVLAAALVPMVLTSVGCNSCKKDDDDKPATTASAAAPAPTPTPVAPATVVPEEDAGAPADAGVDAGKPPGPGGPGGGSGSIAKCCAALQQNANSAPLEQKMYYTAAAQYCNGMRNTPAGQQAFAQIRMFLQGAKMPGACTK